VVNVPVSPLAPDAFPDMPPIPGVRTSSCEAGVRYAGRLDLMLACFAPGTTVGGVMTKSQTAGAPVIWNRLALTAGAARGLIVNSGNANVFTGRRGTEAVKKTVHAVATALECRKEEVFVCSTGTIGEYLLEERVVSKVDKLSSTLSNAKWQEAAHAIMTTDTFAKGATLTADINGTEVTINGIAKGSGMIAPDMATMLGYIFTDANIEAAAIQAIIAEAAEKSFNCISVDGDTSTSDTLLMFATGQADHAIVTNHEDARLDDFRRALLELCVNLAHQIVCDGEGATKFIEIRVYGAENNDAARAIGLSIGNSPLVKTAVAGADANWGRIVMAIGKAGELADRDKLAITIGGIAVACNGEMTAGYDETLVTKHMKKSEILIEVDVAVGPGSATIWTCDLTHGYIDINADYRT